MTLITIYVRLAGMANERERDPNTVTAHEPLRLRFTVLRFCNRRPIDSVASVALWTRVSRP